jgi:glyoxylase-like metal-dependent hydrolase (beta-lactamase superfamily II)
MYGIQVFGKDFCMKGGFMGQFMSRKHGKWTLSVINAGIVKMDGGAIFGVVPKPLWEKRLKADHKNRVTLGMHCLVVQNGNECMLVETGFGGKVNDKMREIYGLKEEPGLLLSLREIGVTPEQVTRVIVTHLHQDHAGGCTVLTAQGYKPAFPNATYYFQKGEWDAARHADAQTVNGYRVEEVMKPLAENGVVKFLDGDSDICEGVQVHLTPGHTQFHQSVLIRAEENTYCYVGDLIPTTHHLKPIYTMAYDLYPRETFINKQHLVEQASKENWILIWSHDLEIPWSRIVPNEQGEYVAEPI